MLSEKLTAVLLLLPLLPIVVVSIRYLIEFRKQEARGPGKRYIGYSRVFLVLLGVGYFGIWPTWVGAIVLLFLDRYYAGFHYLPLPLPTVPFVPILGLAILYTGSFLFAWAVGFAGKYLRPSVSGVHANHRLVQGGPLGIVRHPYYVSYVLVLVGLGLTLTTLWPLLLALCVAIGMGPVARAEEEEMKALFGEEYEQYQQRVGRFWPTLWH
jgi:protein-S-isoprenylcysteine O-methyltransferase Ste14